MEEANLDEKKIQNKKPKYYVIGFRILLFLAALSLMAVFVNHYIFRSKASQDVATVVLTPSTHDISVGETLSQSIQISSGEKKIAAVTLRLNYDSSYLQYIPKGDSFLNSTIPAAYFTDVISETVAGSGNTKYVKITMIANKANSSLLNNVVIPFQFKALAEVEQTTLSFYKPHSIIVGTTGSSSNHQFSIDSDNAEAEVKIRGNTGGNIKAKLLVKLQGITKTPDAANKIKVGLKIYGKGDNRQELSEVELVSSSDNDGVFFADLNFDELTPGKDFQLFIKGPMHIQKRYCDLEPTGGTGYHCTGQQGFELVDGENTINLTAVPLLVGDLPPQDGVLNSVDVVAIKDCIKEQTTECINKTDVNLDGITNGTDYSLLISSMGVKYDDEE